METWKKTLITIIGTDNKSLESSNQNEIELGKFSTNILDKTENRQSNIRLTCSKLNNLTIESKQMFSFLETLGETSEATRL
jgi:vancomycin resistance protein YoaR